MLQLCKDATLPQPPRKTDPLLMMSYAYCNCGGPRYVHTVKHETADPFNLNKASVDRGRFPPLCCLLQFICAANCFCHTRAHTHSYTHATQWCRCSEGKDAPKYFRNRLAAERNMKLMKGTAEAEQERVFCEVERVGSIWWWMIDGNQRMSLAADRRTSALRDYYETLPSDECLLS